MLYLGEGGLAALTERRLSLEADFAVTGGRQPELAHELPVVAVEGGMEGVGSADAGDPQPN